MAVLVSVLYVTKLELYAGLPQELPSSLLFYGVEVSFWSLVHWIHVLCFFQDMPCIKRSSSHREDSFVDTKMINQDNKVKETVESETSFQNIAKGTTDPGVDCFDQ